MIRKKFVSTIALTLSFLLFVVINSSVFASKLEASSSNMSNSFFISLYNDIDDSYIVENTRLSIPSEPTTVLKTSTILFENGLVDSFTTSDGTINSVVIDNQKYESSSSSDKQSYFYAKLNGERLSTDDNQTIIKSGDIVEWIFSDAFIDEGSMSSESKPTSQITVQKKSEFWNDNTAKSFNSACDWLNRSRENSTLYLTVFGIAGKTANTKQVNELLNELSQKAEYSTSTEIANKVLAASFCGFDASASKYGMLISKLSTYPDISKQGAVGYSYALIAYDSNQYDISSISINARKTLVDDLLKYQNEDGGFAETLNAKSSNDATACAVIALSNYQERKDVKLALEKAVDYFTDNKISYVSTSDGVARLICALNSIDIEIGDKRFIIDNLNLMEYLLLYQNNDGGFAHIFEAESTVASTEQAIIALSSIKKSGNPYRLSTLVEKYKEPEPEKSVEVIKESNAAMTIVIISAVAIALILVLIICIKLAKKKK